jgi:uncharacterized membrane protein
MVSYIVSYVFVAIIWINHHYLMSYLTVPSLRIVWFNFGHLFWCRWCRSRPRGWPAANWPGPPSSSTPPSSSPPTASTTSSKREIIRHSESFTEPEIRRIRRRSLLALVLFTAAALLATVNSWLGFGAICLALALHLRPDASNRRRHSSP